MSVTECLGVHTWGGGSGCSGGSDGATAALPVSLVTVRIHAATGPYAPPGTPAHTKLKFCPEYMILNRLPV